MGVIINETITLSNGLNVTDPYVSVGENDIRIEKNVNFSQHHETDPETGEIKTTTNSTIEYVTEGRFTMWVSQVDELGRARKAPHASNSIGIDNIQVEVKSDSPPTGNVYDLLYNKLKTMKTCIDAI